jgi:uncharacterized OB-fold protein/acyl dehydratase
MAERVARAGQSSPRQARDPVNLPMIRNWIEAIGDVNPVYIDAGAAAASVHGSLVAPPAMIQVWTMPGLHGARDGTDPLGQMSAVLDAAGFTSVVATNCDQVYHRYLRHGEHLAVRTELVDVIGPKRTALGEGWFVTTRSTWYSGDEAVATMDFRILKFRPPSAGSPAEPAGAAQAGPAQAAQAGPAQAAQAGAPSAETTPGGFVLRPMISPDTAFFWAGTAVGELRVQRCGDCGALRHPPGPMCPKCGAGTPEYLVAAGTGQIYSYVVHHHPPVPGKRLPIVIVLVQLDEGVRMLGELLGADPAQVRIGLPVRVEYVRIDAELAMPAWRLAEAQPAMAQPAMAQPAVGQLPELAIEASATFVVSTALATRDFQDVHHDRDQAVARGSKDIFLNILTTTGLVQRYVVGWAGPGSIVREISIRLGAPCYAGDTLTFSGHVTKHVIDQRAADAADAAGAGRADAAGDRAAGRYEISVAGRCSLGDHVTGTVRLDIPTGRS